MSITKVIQSQRIHLLEETVSLLQHTLKENFPNLNMIDIAPYDISSEILGRCFSIKYGNALRPNELDLFASYSENEHIKINSIRPNSISCNSYCQVINMTMEKRKNQSPFFEFFLIVDDEYIRINTRDIFLTDTELVYLLKGQFIHGNYYPNGNVRLHDVKKLENEIVVETENGTCYLKENGSFIVDLPRDKNKNRYTFKIYHNAINSTLDIDFRDIKKVKHKIHIAELAHKFHKECLEQNEQ